MATKLIFRNVASPAGIATPFTNLLGVQTQTFPRSLNQTNGAAKTSTTRAGVTGPTVGVEFGTTTAWTTLFISEAVSADVTISGSVTFNLWAAEGAMTLNMAINCRILVLDGASGALTQVHKTVNAAELSTSTTNGSLVSFSETPTSFNVKKGDRIVLIPFLDDGGGNMATGGSGMFVLDGPIGTEGDSYVSFTETFSFVAQTGDPAGTALYLTNDPASGGINPGAEVEYEVWTARGGAATTAVTNSVTGPTNGVVATLTAGGSAVAWFTRPLDAVTLDGKIVIAIRAHESATAANARLLVQLFKTANDGTSPTLIAVGWYGSELTAAEAEYRVVLVADDVSIASGERLKLVVAFDDSDAGGTTGAMVTGYTLIITFDGPTGGASGDSYLLFENTLSEPTTKIIPTAIDGAEAVNSPVVVHGAVSIVPAGIASEQALGSVIFQGPPAIVVTQTGFATSGAGLGFTAVAGRIIICAIACRAAGTTVTPVAGAILIGGGNSTNNSNIRLYAKLAVGGETTIISSASSNPVTASFELSGAQLSGMSGSVGVATTDATYSCPAQTPIAGTTCIIVGAGMQDAGNNNHTAANGFTGVTGNAPPSGQTDWPRTIALYRLVPSASGSYTPQFTSGNGWRLGVGGILYLDGTPIPITPAGIASAQAVGTPIVKATKTLAPVGIASAQAVNTPLFNSATGYAKVVLGATPTGYWRLGEPSGTSAVDSSGGGNDGTYTGGFTLAQAGALTGDSNTAVALNGTSGYVSIPHDSSLDTGDVFSLECWVKRDVLGVPGDSYLFSKGDGNYRLGFNNDGIEIAQKAVAIIALSSYGITDTTAWHHVVWTKNGSINKIYLDGRDVTGSVTNSTISNTTDPVMLGNTSSGGFFDGTIDEAAIYDYALTPAEVAEHYATGIDDGYGLEVLADAPSAWYRMHGEFINIITGHNNGLGSNSPTEVAALVSGDPAAYSFYGPDSEFVDIAESPDPFPYGNASRTIEAWIQTSATGVATPIFTYGSYSGTLRNFFTILINSSNQLFWTDSVTFQAFGSAGQLNDGLVHHVVMTWDGTNIRAYDNSVEMSSSPLALGAALATLAGNAWIATNGSDFPTIVIDEVAVYPSVLTPTRILAHFNNGFVVGPQTILPTAITSAEVVGSHTLLAGDVSILPTSVAPAQALGSPTLVHGAVAILPVGIASAQALGAPVVLTGGKLLSVSAIVTAEAVGTPTLVHGAADILPTGIATGQALGTPVLTTGAVAILPSGIATAEAVGSHTLVSPILGVSVQPTAIPGAEVSFDPTDIPGLVLNLKPADIVALTMVGSPAPTVVTGVINGQPVARFTANEGRVRLTSTGIGLNYSVFHVSRLRTAAMGRVVGATYPPSNLLVGFWNGFQNVFYVEGFLTPDARVAQTTDWQLFTLIGIGEPGDATAWAYKDGVFQSGNHPVTGGWQDTLSIGGYDPTGAAETPDADVAEILIYDTGLSDTDRERVENYLREKYFGSGAASSQFGTPTLVQGAGVFPQTILPSAIVTDEAVGTPTVVHGGVLIQTTGIASAEAVGTPTLLKGGVLVLPTGIASAEAVGTPTLTRGGVLVVPTAIISLEAVGTHTLVHGGVIIAPVGIATAEVVNTPVLPTGAAVILPTSIATAQAVGSPTVIKGSAFIIPTGIASQEALGAPTLLHGGVAIVVSSIASAQAVGLPILVTGAGIIYANAAAVGEAFGVPTITTGGVVIAVSSVASGEAVGTPGLFQARAIAPTAIVAPGDEVIPQERMLPDTAPANYAGSGNYVLGDRFQVLADGFVTHARYYHVGGCNPGASHPLRLYDPGGTKIAEVDDTAAGGAAAGWREVAYATPVPVTAGNFYVAGFQSFYCFYAYTYQDYTPGLAPHLSHDTAYYIAGYEGMPSTIADGYTYHNDVVFQAGGAVAPAVGSPTLLPGNTTILAVGIASAQAVGTPAFITGAGVIVPTGIPSAQAVGSPTILAGSTAIAPSGIPSAEAIGAPSLIASAKILPSAIGPGESVGTPILLAVAAIQPGSIASGQALGTPALTTGGVTIVVSGIASAQGVGSPILVALGGPRFLAIAAINPQEVFGTPTLLVGSVAIAPAGIASGQVVSNPTLVTVTSIQPTGIASAEAFGSQSVLHGATSIVTPSIGPQEALGSPTIVVAGVTIVSQGVPTGEVLGTAIVRAGTVNVQPNGISTAELLGSPIVLYQDLNQYFAPVGITSRELFGLPRLIPGITFIQPEAIDSAEAFGTVRILGKRLGWSWVNQTPAMAGVREGGWPVTQDGDNESKDGGWPELQDGFARPRKNEGEG